MSAPAWVSVGRRVRFQYPDGTQSNERVSKINKTTGLIEISNGQQFQPKHLSARGDFYQRTILGKSEVIRLYPFEEKNGYAS